MNNVISQVSIYFETIWMFFQNEINAGDFTKFCHCRRSARDNTEKLESPVKYERLGNYEFLKDVSGAWCHTFHKWVQRLPTYTMLMVHLI